MRFGLRVLLCPVVIVTTRITVFRVFRMRTKLAGSLRPAVLALPCAQDDIMVVKL